MLTAGLSWRPLEYRALRSVRSDGFQSSLKSPWSDLMTLDCGGVAQVVGDSRLASVRQRIDARGRRTASSPRDEQAERNLVVAGTAIALAGGIHRERIVELNASCRRVGSAGWRNRRSAMPPGIPTMVADARSASPGASPGNRRRRTACPS